MFLLPRWIRRWREERQLLKETRAREAEREVQREKRDHRQAQALLLTLHELQRTMDPLVAAQVYNNRFCPLARLPEELLLHITDFLGDDPVTLRCLQIVSRVFRRLLDPKVRTWGSKWYTIPSDIKIESRHSTLYVDPRMQLRRLLQRDGRCDNCRHWNDNYRPGHVYDACKFKPACPSPHGHTQRFGPYDRIDDKGRLYCDPCNSHHRACQFSPAYQDPVKHIGERRCLGQQGSVQLCEHVQITWASIKADIDDWRKQQQQHRGDWLACLDSFNIECHNVSHGTRCTAFEAPTWPRARLCVRGYNNSVFLMLEWAPHSRIDDTFALTTDGRIPASELRALFQRLRRLGPVEALHPPGRPGALPEMSCCSPLSPLGPVLYYETGEGHKTRHPRRAFAPILTGPRYAWLNEDLFNGYNGRVRWHNGMEVNVSAHYLRGTVDHFISLQCLVISYTKEIMVCKRRDMKDPDAKIIPTGHWLHAMDPRTYPHPQGPHIRPQCRNETCTNYYRLLKTCHSISNYQYT